MEEQFFSAGTLAAFTGAGCLIGFIVGIALTCLLTAAGRADEWTEEYRRKNGLPPED